MNGRRDKDLQRYFDGELAGRRARRLREELERSPADQKRMAGLQRLRGALRDAVEESAEDASFDGLWGCELGNGQNGDVCAFLMQSSVSQHAVGGAQIDADDKCSSHGFLSGMAVSSNMSAGDCPLPTTYRLC